MRTNLKYLLIVSLLFLVACQPAETVSFQYELTEQHPWVSFDVFTENHHDGVVNWRLHQHAIIHYAGDESLVFMESYDVEIPNRISYAFMLNKKEYVEIDHDNLEIMQYANKRLLWDDYHGYGIGESFGYYFGNLQYFVRPIKGINLLLTSFIYTIDSCGSMFVEGKTYNRYHGVQPLFAQCDSTGCTKIRIEKDWFINEETKIVDSMCLIAYPTEQEDWQQYVSVRNVDYSDKQRYIDSVFEIGHQRYEKYDKCNRNKDRLSRGYSENKEYNAAVLDYPMMDIDGNATTIAEHEGWLLLKYWSFACPSCIVDLKRIGREKDTVGSCMIEREGIEVLAINYASDNLELLQTFASKTHTGDIVYSAKGIGNHIDMGRYLGAIQLLSPDKQFVYRAAAVDDYTEILKAKSDYEKQHPNLLK